MPKTTTTEGIHPPSIRTNPPLRLTIDEASAYTTVAPITIRRALSSGKLRSARLGRRHIIKLSELDRWIDSQTTAVGCDDTV